MKSSLFQTVSYLGKEIIIKRDDQIDETLNGNKYYKLYGLLEHLNKTQNFDKKIVSMGGVQSNFMQALSALCHCYQIPLDYWVRTIPKTLLTHPNANLAFALKHGMALKVASKEAVFDKTHILRHYQGQKMLWLNQGGADRFSQVGFKLLAKQIQDYCDKKHGSQATIFMPSGTGASMLFLRRYLPAQYTVATVPCIGDKK